MRFPRFSNGMCVVVAGWVLILLGSETGCGFDFVGMCFMAPTETDTVCVGSAARTASQM